MGHWAPLLPRGQLKCDVHARSHENPRLRMPCRVLGQNRVAFDAHVAIFEAIKAHDPELADARMRSHLDQVGKLYWKVRRAGK